MSPCFPVTARRSMAVVVAALAFACAPGFDGAVMSFVEYLYELAR